MMESSVPLGGLATSALKFWTTDSRASKPKRDEVLLPKELMGTAESEPRRRKEYRYKIMM
jgi:hypothetical protein